MARILSFVVASMLMVEGVKASMMNPSSVKPSNEIVAEWDIQQVVSEFSVADDAAPLDASVTLKNDQFQSPRRIEAGSTIASDRSVKLSDEELIEVTMDTFHKLMPGYEAKVQKIRRGLAYTYVTLVQTALGRRVVNSEMTVRLTHQGDFQTINSSMVNPKFFPTEVRALSDLKLEKNFAEPISVYYEEAVMLPKIVGDRVSVIPCREFGVSLNKSKTEAQIWINEETGAIEVLRNPRTHLVSEGAVQVTGGIFPNAEGDTRIATALPFVTFNVDGAIFNADEKGEVPFEKVAGKKAKITLENHYITVVNDGGEDNSNVVDFSSENPGTVSVDKGAIPEEVNLYHWVNEARKFVNQKLNYHELDKNHNNLSGKDSRLVVIARHGDRMDNAYFSPMTYVLAFGTGQTIFKNTALAKDVVLHEFGHFFTQEVYGSVMNYEFSAMNEAMSDFFAAMVTNDPTIGEGSMKAYFKERFGTDYLRTVENKFTWPASMSGRSFHEDGQIFSGALWDLRKDLGAELVDQMFHEARLAQAKTIAEFYLELLKIDDGLYPDQDKFRSKNSRRIAKAFHAHGINHMSSLYQISNPENLTEPWRKPY